MNKKRKRNLLLLFVLLLAVTAAFAALKMYNKRAPSNDGEEMETYKVIEIDSSMVKEIGIIAQGENVNLLKKDGQWKALEDESFQVDENQVDNFLASISSITSDVKIEDVTDMAQYGLVSPSLNITLQWEDNMYTIKVGDYNSVIDSYYLNINDENIVYTADSSLFYALNKSLSDFELAREAVETQVEEGGSQD